MKNSAALNSLPELTKAVRRLEGDRAEPRTVLAEDPGRARDGDTSAHRLRIGKVPLRPAPRLLDTAAVRGNELERKPVPRHDLPELRHGPQPG